MFIFEIHITGGAGIIAVAEKLGFKAITVSLRDPYEDEIRREYMTSQQVDLPNAECAIALAKFMAGQIEEQFVKVTRIKVETPALFRQFWDRALYMESHFHADNFGDYPVSKQPGKVHFMGTDRTWDHDEFESHNKHWEGRGQVEVALFDSNPNEDNDWLAHWELDARQMQNK